MIKIKFEDHAFRIPNQWGDIKLCEYEQWIDYRPSSQRSYVQYVSKICGVDEDILLAAPSHLFDVINDSIQFVYHSDLPPASSVVVDGKEYVADMSTQLTLGQWVDIEDVMSGDGNTKVSAILSIVCLQKGEEYSSTVSEERRHIFANLSCDKALPLYNFFLYKKNESDTILHHYSNLLAQVDQYLKDTKIFAESGVGIKQLPIWQKIRYKYLRRSLAKQLSKYSDFYSTK